MVHSFVGSPTRLIGSPSVVDSRRCSPSGPSRHQRCCSCRAQAGPQQETQDPASKPNRETRRRSRVQRLAPDQPVEQLAGQSEPPADATPQLDSSFFLLPLALFGLTFIEGFLLAVSGFLPEDIDNLVTTFVYPASLPTLVAFLASSLFLLLKAKQAEKDSQ